ncbi:hypothetical protein SFC57_08610 [Niallia circulans]|uniref:hypothetical protein n=1 Tax=Niallia circulans TaxID=1397 RepID=UPI001560E476|nr:hypothetical protein [Niallia circulans]NRG33296.1 hypothetical protein [Niallia circulans]
MKNFSFHTNHREREKSPETRIKLIPLTGTQSRSEILKKIEISSQFNMRYRGLYEYYGDDLIAYKKENPADYFRNEFLRTFSSYLTDYLEDNMPTSWHKCKKSFIELLLLIHLPNALKISQERNSMQHFISEFKKFSIWLDHREKTTWTKMSASYGQTFHELQICEDLLNRLYLQMYPQFFASDWDYQKDLSRVRQLLEECTEVEDNFFQISTIDRNTVYFSNLHTKKQFQVNNFPIEEQFLGLILHGSIGRLEGHSSWSLLLTAGVYPKRAKRYLTLREN